MNVVNNDWAAQRFVILYGIARTMEYLHRRSFMHQDLNPGSILLDDELKPVIIDLGFAKHFNWNIYDSQSSTSCGTRGVGA
jgi:serine/threonine protein kinase